MSRFYHTAKSSKEARKADFLDITTEVIARTHPALVSNITWHELIHSFYEGRTPADAAARYIALREEIVLHSTL